MVKNLLEKIEKKSETEKQKCEKDHTKQSCEFK